MKKERVDTDEEVNRKGKVLDFLLHSKIEKDNKVYIALNSFGSVPNMDRHTFARHLTALEYDGLIQIKYMNDNRKDGSSVCWATMLSPALTYFEDKSNKRRDRLFASFKITTREVTMLAIGALFTGVVAVVIGLLSKP